MVNVDILNNSQVNSDKIASFSKQIGSRLESVDFEKFDISSYCIHVLINADSNSLRYTTKLPSDKRYIMYQGIPNEYAYNSSYEAKLSTIRLRIQNVDIPFEHEIENIVFVVDFSTTNANIDEDQPNSSNSKNANKAVVSDVLSSMKRVFAKKEDSEDEEKKRKAMFIPVAPKYSLSNVIMTKEMSEQIMDALSIIRNRRKIYEEWGFNEIDSQPKAVLSFWGPPGTGKTMCAHAIARDLGAKILAVNYAEIESKYAGESPKNLIAAFNAAQENGAVLFFDEADSFLGKRISNVQSGHDQSINSLRSQMLIQLEDFEGVVIFATNLVKNFDKAFETRILRHIKFDLPDTDGRTAIYSKMIPSKVPTDHKFDRQDYELLSRASDNFSGRDIRNSVLDTLSAAAKNNRSIITIDDFLFSIKTRQDSYAKLKEDKNAENKQIAEDIKNSLIEKSKQDLNEALVGIAIYAAWADGKMEPSEDLLLREFSSALNVTIPTGFDINYLPPLPSIVSYFNTKEKKFKAIDVAVRIVAIDGDFASDEITFVKNLCQLLQFSSDVEESIIAYSHSLAKLNSEWNSILNK